MKIRMTKAARSRITTLSQGLKMWLRRTPPSHRTKDCCQCKCSCWRRQVVCRTSWWRTTMSIRKSGPRAQKCFHSVNNRSFSWGNSATFNFTITIQWLCEIMEIAISCARSWWSVAKCTSCLILSSAIFAIWAGTARQVAERGWTKLLCFYARTCICCWGTIILHLSSCWTSMLVRGR